MNYYVSLICSLKMVNFVLNEFHFNKIKLLRIKNKLPNAPGNSSGLRTKKKFQEIHCSVSTTFQREQFPQNLEGRSPILEH